MTSRAVDCKGRDVCVYFLLLAGGQSILNIDHLCACHLWAQSSQNSNVLRPWRRRMAGVSPEAHMPRRFCERLCHVGSQELANLQCYRERLWLWRFGCHHPQKTQLLESKLKAHIVVQPQKLKLVPTSPHKNPLRSIPCHQYD